MNTACAWPFLLMVFCNCGEWERRHMQKRVNQTGAISYIFGLSLRQKVWASLMKQYGWPSTTTQTHRCQRSSLVTQSVKAVTPSTFPLMSLNTWRPLFTFPLTLPHRFVTLPKGAPLAWPYTEPPALTYTQHTHTRGWYVQLRLSTSN